MPEIEIYTSPLCGFCHRAKSLLTNKGAEFAEYDVTSIPGKRDEMIERAGGKTTVPQIFIDGKHVGGCDDLFELDYDDQLDPLLGIG